MVNETFIGTLGVGSYRFYSFAITTNGTVNATLDDVSGAGVPDMVQLALGIGQPSGTDCSATTTSNVGLAGVVTGTFGPGSFCVRVSDVGQLSGPAAFNIAIQHP